ncbi:MAG TPA: YIP1 family protein [Thermoanaerobaculaceae bacterium]|nr:YIP1 family protein [Thermoanaerobaculaceae bacterium]
MAETYPPGTPPMPPGPPGMQPPGTVPPPPPGGTPPPPAATALPWEQPGYPALEGLYETAKLVITSPSQAFARMSLTGTLGKPILYAIIFGWVGIIANQIYSIALRGAMMGFLSNLPGYNPRMTFGLPMFMSVGLMIVAPVFVLIGVLIWSAIVHLFLMLVGGANTGFSSTVRVVCYTGTVQVLQVIPLCGGMIAAVWALVLYIIGIAIAHRTTQGKAALAVLLPLVLCCVCIAIIAIAFGAAIAAAIGHFGHLGHLAR